MFSSCAVAMDLKYILTLSCIISINLQLMAIEMMEYNNVRVANCRAR